MLDHPAALLQNVKQSCLPASTSKFCFDTAHYYLRAVTDSFHRLSPSVLMANVYTAAPIGQGLKDLDSYHPSKRQKVTNACTECHRRKQKCDRQQPCTNCIARRMGASCRFDYSLSSTDASNGTEELTHSKNHNLVHPAGQTNGLGFSPKNDTGDLGYSLTKGSNAFVGIKQLLQNETEFNAISAVHNRPAERPLPDAKSASFLSRLPAKHIIDELVVAFFANVNWHYFILEKYYFDCLFACFYGAPLESVKHLNREDIFKELRYFPAMLFQVLGLAIQFLPFESPIWKTLAPNDSVTCHRYSDIGMELMTHLGRETVALAAIQADFLRAAWFKNIGKGVEAWYSVGIAIRSAQELELHRKRSSNIEKTPSQIWYEEYKRRLWMNLFIWDSLTAMILGRPRTIHPDDCDVQLPLECNIPREPTTTVQGTHEAQGEWVGPNTVSTNLFMYRISALWNTVRASKADKPFPADYTVVERFDMDLRAILYAVPPTLRHQDPDTSWDEQYPYLVQQREDVLTKAHLLLTALHRPHMASQPASRRAALQSAIITLDSQQRSFARTSPHQYKLFGLSFYTVDASLLLSVVATMDLPLRDDIQANVDRVLSEAVARLSITEPHNPIARSGLSILFKCYGEFKARCRRDTSASVPEALSSSLTSRQRRSLGPPSTSDGEGEEPRQERHEDLPLPVPDPISTFAAEAAAINDTVTIIDEVPTARLPTSSSSDDAVSSATQPTDLLPPLPSLLTTDVLQTTDFDESYWLFAIDQISPLPSTGQALSHIVPPGPEQAAATFVGVTVPGDDGGEGEFESVWNSLEFFDPN